jgi:hypothetical protein
MFLITACTNEARNNLGREVQNWTGTNGVLDIDEDEGHFGMLESPDYLQ